MNISLYIHFPFCKKKCNYCDFYSVGYSEKMFDIFLSSICKEWEMVQDKYFEDDVIVNTIFFGGGTPSLISKNDWLKFNNLFLSKIQKNENCEITLECNPESFNEEKVDSWIYSGINRLSIGVQSLIDKELEILGRIHNSTTVTDLLENKMLKQFDSINVDLMFGIPNQTLNSLQKTLSTILSFDIIKHLSIYELTLSEGTNFFESQKNLSLPEDKKISEMYELIIDRLQIKNIFQYEVSNFSKKNYECQHNLKYWNYSPYIGLGPGAHSFINNSRFANVANLEEYNQKISLSTFPYQFSELLTIKEIESELIFLGLRMVNGIDEVKFKKLTGNEFFNNKRGIILNQLKKDGFLIYKKQKWIPTQKGMLYADSIAEKLT